MKTLNIVIAVFLILGIQSESLANTKSDSRQELAQVISQSFQTMEDYKSKLYADYDQFRKHKTIKYNNDGEIVGGTKTIENDLWW